MFQDKIEDKEESTKCTICNTLYTKYSMLFLCYGRKLTFICITFALAPVTSHRLIIKKWPNFFILWFFASVNNPLCILCLSVIAKVLYTTQKSSIDVSMDRLDIPCSRLSSSFLPCLVLSLVKMVVSLILVRNMAVTKKKWKINIFLLIEANDFTPRPNYLAHL